MDDKNFEPDYTHPLEEATNQDVPGTPSDWRYYHVYEGKSSPTELSMASKFGNFTMLPGDKMTFANGDVYTWNGKSLVPDDETDAAYPPPLPLERLTSPVEFRPSPSAGLTERMDAAFASSGNARVNVRDRLLQISRELGEIATRMVNAPSGGGQSTNFFPRR